MKLATLTHEVETNLPVSAIAEMKIVQNAKMFEMLAGLYSDVPKAIWRELIANADDASRGTARPFQVALPSASRPVISIKDFGPGMSHQFMTNGYTWVGHSTKSDTNGQIGGFGLGRLAPIAYKAARSYTVVSIHEGVKRIYAVYKNSTGVPEVGLTHEEATDEPSGVEIMVPIAREDYELFERKLKEVLRWFDPSTYEVFGTTIDPVQYNLKSDSYYEIAQGEQYNFCLMGPVAYQIDWRQIGQELPTSIVPIFQIGELDLPPSREQVSYSPITLKAMRERFAQISEDLPPRAIAEAAMMTPLQRLTLVENLRASKLRPLFEEYHKAAGHRKEDQDARKVFELKYGTSRLFKPKWGEFLLREHERITVQGNFTTYQQASSRAHGYVRKGSASHTSNLEFNYRRDLERTCYFLNDLGDIKNPRFVDRMDQARRRNASYVVVHDAAAFEELKTFIDAGYFFKLSELEPPPREPRSKSRMLHYVSGPGWEGYTSESGELPEDGFYVPFFEGEPDYRAKPCVGQGWRDIVRIEWAKAETYYGFSQVAQKKVELEDFQRLDHWIMDMAKQALADPTVVRALSARVILDQAQNKLMYRFARPRADAGDTSLMTDAVTRLQAVIRDLIGVNQTTLQSLVQLAGLGAIKLPKTKDFHRVIPALERAEKRNPQLALLINVFDRKIGNPFTSPETQAALQKMVK